MSDRTPASVRTGSRDGNGAPEEPRPEGAPPVSATQSIPASGAMRAQQAGTATGASPAQSRAGAPVGPPPAGPVPAGQAPTGQAPTGQAPAGQAPGGPARATAPAGRPAGAAGKARGRAAGRGPRRARLQLRHIDIWSAFKISLVLSIVLFFIWIIAIAILYAVLSSLGVFSTVNDLFGQLGSASGQAASGGTQVVTAKVVFTGAAVIGAINVILWTALCTVATFIYNMCADLVGGLEVTLSERD